MRSRIMMAASCAFGLALLAPNLTFSATKAASAKGAIAAAPDAIAALAIEMKAGGRPLVFTPSAKGYLPDLLKRLKVAEESQVLAFSRTSLQQGSIGPASPRAIYFSDTISIGYIPGAPLIEMWAVGRDGMVRFYTIRNTRAGGPQVQAEDEDCSICHASQNPAAPGPMMMSVSTLSSGVVSIYDRQTDGRTPIAQRWGGWYVTGRHGDMRHRGNVASDAPSSAAEAGQNLISLAGRFDLAPYPRRTSDIVALMTLEHETGFLNLAGAIQALATVKADPAAMEKAVNDLADYMLGVDAAALSAPVEGNTEFSRRFAAEGKVDRKGRSLRDFDLKTRLFRYPVSYMIYTPAFDALPAEPKNQLYRRLADVLVGRDASTKYMGLPQADREAALEILAVTKPGLPAFWRAS